VQDQSLAWGKAHPEPPALPADLPAANVEARALGLGDLERLQVVAQRADAVGRVGAGPGRHRYHAQVLHPHHRHVVVVDDGVKAMDGLGVGVVVRLFAMEQQSPHQPAVRLLRGRERADAPRLDVHRGGIGDAATFEPGDDLRVGPG